MAARDITLALERFTSFGDLLKFLRRRTGVTQRELSIAVGYSHAQISRLELNQRPPDLATITARFIPALDLEDQPEAAARLLELAAALPGQESPAPGSLPYKGLQFFDEQDADLFFGREALTFRLDARVRALSAPSSVQRFLAVVGASGSGKSSLVRAGLIPVLRKSPPFSRGQIRSFTPTSRPLQALALSLYPAETQLTAVAALIDDLAHDPRTLHLAAERLSANLKPSAQVTPPLLLVIDQFEELFTLARDETERQGFIDNLMTAATQPDGPVMVIITLRADFYSHCAPYPLLRDALASQQEYIGPMDADALRRAIQEPALQGGWKLETGLVELLLQDVGAEGTHQPEPGFLPLLSHALLETWQRRSGHNLSISSYLASGGVRGAIADTADAVYQDQLDDAQRDIARSIFLRLVQIGEDENGLDTRRRATLDELVPSPAETTIVQEVLNRLAAARLVVIGHGSIELAHEALIREWPILRSWLDDDREGLLLHRHLTLAAEGWHRRGRDPGELYRGARLAQASAWSIEHTAALNRLEQEFIAASGDQTAMENAEREALLQHELATAQALAETQQAAAAQLRRRAIYLSIAFVLALVMTGVALFQGNLAQRSAVTAQNEQRISYGRELAAASINNIAIDPERSILLALQAVSTTRSVNGQVLPEAEEALHRALLSSQVRTTLSGHNDWVLSAAYSPDGSRLATLERDGSTIIWDVASGRQLLRWPGITVPGDANGYQRIAYSPDGKLLVTGDGSLVRVWDPASGVLLRELSGHTGDVWCVAFTPDGRVLVSSGADGSLRTWDVATGAPRLALPAHQAAVESLAVRPDGQHIATVSDDHTVKIWDVTSGDLVEEHTDFNSEVYAVAYSPDGNLLAAGNTEGIKVWRTGTPHAPVELNIQESAGGLAFNPDGSQLAGISGSLIKLWDVHTGKELLTLAGHNGWAGEIAISPDGKQLASTSFDKTIKIWSLTPGKEETMLPGTGFRAVYSPDGSRIATAGPDGSVLIWNAETGEQITAMSGHTGEVMSVAFSPDGKRVVSASFDQTAKVWDAASGQPLLTLTGHQIGVRDAAFSPDGKWIATAGFDQTARLWDAATGDEVRQFAGHQGLVLGVSFSPDSTHLATSSTDKTAKIWEVATGLLLLTLDGHTGPLPDIAFSPDGLRIATASGDNTAIIWDSVTGEKLLTLSGHTSVLQSVNFSPDGKLLATGSDDNTAIVWDALTGAELLTFPGSLGGVTSVAFDPRTGSRLAVGSTDGVVRIFLLNLEELVAFARKRVTRELSPWECQKFLHLQQCPPPP